MGIGTVELPHWDREAELTTRVKSELKDQLSEVLTQREYSRAAVETYERVWRGFSVAAMSDSRYIQVLAAPESSEGGVATELVRVELSDGTSVELLRPQLPPDGSNKYNDIGEVRIKMISETYPDIFFVRDGVVSKQYKTETGERTSEERLASNEDLAQLTVQLHEAEEKAPKGEQ